MWAARFAGLLQAYFLINWLPLLLRSSGASLRFAVYGAVTLNVGGVLGSLAISALASRFRPRRTLCGAFLGSAICVALLSWSVQSAALAIPLILILGALCIGTQIATYSVIADHYPLEIRATAMGWTLSVGRLGSIAGPLAAGPLVAAGADAPTLLLASALPAVAAAFLLSRVHYRQP